MRIQKKKKFGTKRNHKKDKNACSVPLLKYSHVASRIANALS
jgi:hypothetical protein